MLGELFFGGGAVVFMLNGSWVLALFCFLVFRWLRKPKR